MAILMTESNVILQALTLVNEVSDNVPDICIASDTINFGGNNGFHAIIRNNSNVIRPVLGHNSICFNVDELQLFNTKDNLELISINKNGLSVNSTTSYNAVGKVGWYECVLFRDDKRFLVVKNKESIFITGVKFNDDGKCVPSIDGTDFIVL
jgi:hypothetical protein